MKHSFRQFWISPLVLIFQERSWYYRGDYRREYQASAARKQYVSDSAVLPTQRYDVDNNSLKGKHTVYALGMFVWNILKFKKVLG